MSTRNEMERLIGTALHCNPVQFVYGTVSGTTIIFGYRFVSAPTVILTPIAGTTASVVTKDVDANGFYITATIETDADFVGWIAIGTGIAVTDES